MHTNYISIKTIRTLLFALILTANGCCLAYSNKTYDYRKENHPPQINKMVSYHLQQAQDKIANKQYSYAWGDLEYIVCNIPNHQIALNQMIKIGIHIDRTAELRKYFQHGISNYPKDSTLRALYSKFLFNINDEELGQAQLDIAIELDPTVIQKSLSNIATNRK